MTCKVLQSCAKCRNILQRLSVFRISSGKFHTNNSSDVDSADIVISGGGMVGAAMACALGQEECLRDKKIVLLETSAQKKFKLPENFSNRTCAISPSSVNLFDSLGAWDEILKMRCQPVKRMQVWDSCSDSLITFNHEELVNDLAYIVENDVILEALTRRLMELSDRVEVRYQTLAKSFVIPGVTPGHDSIRQNSWVTIQTNDDKLLRTKLLIGADGMNSFVRKAGEFHTVSWNYNQCALVATLEVTGTSENTVAWQRFLPTGPIAMLPLSENNSCLIWTTTPENAKNLKEMAEDNFVDAVNDAFWNDNDKNSLAVNLGEQFESLLNFITPGGTSMRQLPPTVVGVDQKSRAYFPLSLIHSSNYVLPRVALIGDAAHRIHPLAGQGVNLGFGDVACLRDTIGQAIYNGADPGSLSYLTKYESTRQRSVLPVAATIDGLQRLYNTKFTPTVVIRSLGLQATNAMQFIKNKIMDQASS